MGLERGAFAFGAANYPLTSDPTDPLLQIADPAIYYATTFLSWAIRNYLGQALTAQAAKVGLNILDAVGTTKAIEPTPFLLQEDLKFPIFALYRKKDVWDEHTIAYDKSTSTWEFAYVLPPLVPAQANALQPILRAVSTILRRVIHMGWDPGYNAGEIVWRTAGLQKARMVDATYGAYTRIDKLSQYYRTLVGTMLVLEREMPRTDQYDDFAGADFALDLATKDASGTETEPLLLDLIDFQTLPPPTIASVSPTSGSSTGGTTVTVTGTNYVVGTRPRIYFGGALADGATVTSSTTATCVTPPYDPVEPSVAVDVVYEAADGQRATLAGGYTFTTP